MKRSTRNHALRILGVSTLLLSSLASLPGTPVLARDTPVATVGQPVIFPAIDQPNPRASAQAANDGAEYGSVAVAGVRKPSDSPLGTNGPRSKVRDKAPGTQGTVDKGAGRLGAGLQDPVGRSSSVADVGPQAASEFQTFIGMNDDDNPFGLQPPDSQVAAGPNHIVEWMNVVGRNYNKAGGIVDGPGALGAGVYDLSDFFGMPAASSVTDPEIIYDVIDDRFFGVFVSEDAGLATGYLGMALSQTSDPTGAWCVFGMQTFAGVFPDFPHIGVTGDKFIVTWNAFPSPSGGSLGSQTRVYQKSDMLACQFTNFVTYAADNANFTSWPAQNQSGGETFGYVGSIGAGGSGTIRVFEITGTPDNADVNRTVTTINITGVTVPPDADQPGTATNINTNDARMLDAHRDGGILWFASTTGCIVGGDLRSCINIMKINQVALTLNDQDIQGINDHYLYYPALNTDNLGNLYVVMGYSGFDVNASILHNGWPAAAANLDGTLFFLKQGESGYTGSRWGDYFAVSRDGGDESCVWVVGEYAFDATLNSEWGQYIGALSYQAGGCTIPQPVVNINSVSVTEGDVGSLNLTFTVTLSIPTSKTVTVNYGTSANTATAGVDYTITSGTLTFVPQDVSQTISVPILGDLSDENSETFDMLLSSPSNATCGDCSGLGTINDNDPLPTLSINNVSLTESNAGTKNFDFTVTLAPASGKTVTVNYNATNGTALAGFDFTAIGTTGLTYTPGQTSKTVTVVVNGDTTCEANETFNVNLGGAVNATIADALGVGTITNDDGTCVNGGKGLNITATGASTKTLGWTGGNAQTGYQLVRYNTATAVATLVALGGGATSYNDAVGGAVMFCYVLAATTDGGAVLGLSDLECALPGQETGGAAPTNFKLQLDQSTNASLSWTNAGGVTTLLLQVIPLDGSAITNINLGTATTSTTQPVVVPDGTCFQLLAFTGAALSTSNVVCGIPGVSTLSVGSTSGQIALDEVAGVMKDKTAGLARLQQ